MTASFNTANPVIAITGVTGYIGARLATMVVDAGGAVLGLSRSPIANPAVRHLPFNLKSGLDESLPDGITALIHLAADTTGTELSELEEINAASSLLAATVRNSRCRFVFVSSQAARYDAPTRYGRVKAAIEEGVLKGGGCVVRLGLVYGREERGLFGTLCALVRKIPVLPAFVPAAKVQPIHVDDVCIAILRIIAAGKLDRHTFNIADPNPLSFTMFLQSIARRRICRRRYFVPFPAIALMVPMSIGAAIAPALRPLRDRLRSLLALPAMDTRDSLEALGLHLRDLDQGMAGRSGSVLRPLIAEGSAILHYVIGCRAPVSAVKLYVRAVQCMDLSPLPTRMITPWKLRLVDGVRSPELRDHLGYDNTIVQRLFIATGVAETNPLLVDRFLLRQQLDLSGVVARVGLAAASEIFWITVRTVCELYRIILNRIR